MKVLLFTHKNDIDGIGNVILSKIAFENVDYIPCATFDLEDKVRFYIESKKIYNYDLIFITDLCLEEELLKIIDNDSYLENHLFIFDHHKTYEKYNNYSFVNVSIRDDKGLCCGTSLFYSHLVNNNYLDNSEILDCFVELTRLHDTWEWITVYNNYLARDLAILFDILGIEGYIKFMYDKLTCDKKFEFNDIELMLINNKKLVIEDTIKGYVDNIYYRNILGMKAGILFINYEFRNEIAEYLRNNKYDIDFVMMIALDKNSISYRSIKDDVSVRQVAEYFGGKGHESASTSPILVLQKEKIINNLIIKND